MSLFRRGDRGPAVAVIRARLASLGLLAGGPGDVADAAFDEACDSAVREFQQRRGLKVDGMVGSETYRALDEARWQLGDRVLHYQVSRPYVGDDVVALQIRLLDLGFDVGRSDGIFGPRTDEAVREFQRNRGLTPDGTFGPVTHRAMEQLRRAVVGGRPGHLREHEQLHQSGRTLAGKYVCVDPGHGGDDPGVVAHGLRECDVVFDLASRLEGRLTAAGAVAIPTRSADGNPSEVDRTAMANEAAVDLYLSLQAEGTQSESCQGIATYYFGDGDSRSSALGERLADLVRHEITARTDLLDGRSHPKTWELLRLTRMPAVQIGIGYLTNPADAARLGQPAFLDILAEAILRAVQRLYLLPEEDPGSGQLQLPALTH